MRLEATAPNEARDAYRRALELNPAHADAHVNLGRLLQEAGAPPAAVEQYRAALEADGGHATAAFNLGAALEDLGRKREAIAAYQKRGGLRSRLCRCPLQSFPAL